MTKSKLKKAIARWRRQRTRLIVITGPRKAGKDVAIDYIMRACRIRHLRIADAPMQIAHLLGLAANRRVLHALFGVNKLLYPVIGESAYKRRVAHILDTEKPRLALVEAIRTKEEYREFVEKRDGILIAISANPEVRYRRALDDAKRGEEKQDAGKKTLKEFLGDPKKKTGEYSPIEREVQWIEQRAHFVIENNYTAKAPVYKALGNILFQLGLARKKS